MTARAQWQEGVRIVYTLVALRAGQLLREMDKAKGAQGTGSNQHEVRLRDATTPRPPTLADLGIEKTEAYRLQALATLPAPALDQHIAAGSRRRS